MRCVFVNTPQQDWQKETAQMGVIYANAECVIAASDARDTSKDCFRTRGPELTDGVTVKYDTSTRRLNTIAPPIKRGWIIDPLQTRGWCCQEHLLTPRNHQIHRRGVTLGTRAGKNNGIGPVAQCSFQYSPVFR